jgi:hypothetical protein
MAAHGHTTTWGTYIGVGRAPQGQGWYAQLNTRWAARQHARLACPSRKPEDMHILDFFLSCPHPGSVHFRSCYRSS